MTMDSKWYLHVNLRQMEIKMIFLSLFQHQGSSPNIINALKTAKESGLITIGLTGSNGFEMAELCDSCIIVPSVETPRIQEAHILIGHILCSYIEQEMFGKIGDVRNNYPL